MQSRLTLRVTTQDAPQSMAPGEVTGPAVLVTVSLRVAVSVRSTGSQICSCGLQTGGSAAAGPAVTASTTTDGAERAEHGAGEGVGHGWCLAPVV